jgi:RimJ/RimL family protein N-acetyltransferase
VNPSHKPTHETIGRDGTMKQPPTLIEGVRVRLRRSSPDDAPQTFRTAAHPEVMKYMDWPAHKSEADARAYLEGCERRWDSGAEYHWMILSKPSTQVIGSISARVHGHAADFGYLLAHEAWGQGLGTEAAGLLLGWLKRQPDIVRIWATTDHENERSARLLSKLGLQREGLLRRATMRPQLGGAPRDTAVYAWVREGVAG